MLVHRVLFGLFSYRIAVFEEKKEKNKCQENKTENGIMQPLELLR